MRTINRRDLLLFGAASAGSSLIVFPTITHAVIPPPPISPWYLIFIADGIYKISNLLRRRSARPRPGPLRTIP